MALQPFLFTGIPAVELEASKRKISFKGVLNSPREIAKKGSLGIKDRKSTGNVLKSLN